MKTFAIWCATIALATCVNAQGLPGNWPPAFQNIDRVGPNATPESRARRRFLKHKFGGDVDRLPELLPFCHFALRASEDNPNPRYRARFLALNCKIEDGVWIIMTW